MKLVAMLYKRGTVVYFLILEQEGFTKEEFIFNGAGMKIVSASVPELEDRIVYIRGRNRDKDLTAVYHELETQKEADEYFAKVIMNFELLAKKFRLNFGWESTNIFTLS